MQQNAACALSFEHPGDLKNILVDSQIDLTSIFKVMLSSSTVVPATSSSSLVESSNFSTRR